MPDFSTLRAANVERSNSGTFNPIDSWSPSDWSNAMGGEAGEAQNIVKKMRRIAESPESMPADTIACAEYADLIVKLADELADVVITADLLAARLGISLDRAITHKFNKDSMKRKSSVRL